MKELDQDFSDLRKIINEDLRSIIVVLISQIKSAQLDIKHLKGYIKALYDLEDKGKK